MQVLFYYIYLIPLTLSAFSSLKVFRLEWFFPYRLFSVLLLSTWCLELAALFWKYFLHTTPWWHYSTNNVWMYNCFMIPSYLLYMYFYRMVLKRGWIKKMISYCMIAYSVFALINILFVQKSLMINSYTIITANMIMVWLTALYFIQVLKGSALPVLSREPLVWISVGAFIFHLGTLPCFILLNYFNVANMPLALSLFRIIVTLNTFMYTSYSIAFLCKTNSQIRQS